MKCKEEIHRENYTDKSKMTDKTKTTNKFSRRKRIDLSPKKNF